ncbi:2Fe-2S iron-sulfur cluster-binding protein [Streptomyces palmae]|uniref:2Fe-2S iron-sulfur cluster binding domain-containing protein n=1 Tax=Streptomyces palmae TaxID=1701085 RepID=A0A4Z0GBW3_9ACTN|nr:2Fe-2S iron-sulfur cluster-binding protein [Streptomyces palmae]TGA92694.1 2Fe-2S iron-sulfur cluster binding domain-containing protein [Streptomyces palmae]
MTSESGSGTVPEPGRATGWHRLRVAAVHPLTEEAVAIGLEVPTELAGTFAHRAGQHVTVRHVLAGREIRRSYSVCPPPGRAGELRLVVKRLGPDGFGAYATDRLAAGDELELAPPTGDFGLADRPGAHHVMVAGGSGITPLHSMAAAALRRDPDCRVSLVYSNRTARSTLLADELADLKDAHPARFFALYVLTRETREAELLSGRMDGDRLPRLLALLGAAPGERTRFYLCGPWGLLDGARRALAACGADPSRVRFELFTAGGEPAERPAPRGAEAGGRGERITARLWGRTTVSAMEAGDQVVLDAVLRARPETPYSCRDGLCGACRAKVVSGSVAMGRQYALGEPELAAGYTLTCRARPQSQDVGLDFDA